MKDRTVLISIVLALSLLVVWTAWGNVTISVTEYDIASEKLPNAFDGLRIVQISDLHNAQYGKNNSRLLHKIEKAEPDLIAVTGDVIDRQHTEEQVVLCFLSQLVNIAPCYYVTGNHEASLSEELRTELFAAMEGYGVTILPDSCIDIERDGEVIQLCGLQDPAFSESEIYQLPEKIGDPACFRILLAHRPQYLDGYTAAGVDLVLSGHMHGGQYRIPFVGGLIGSDTELFPEFDAGLFTKNETRMIVSRGLGNSVVRIRFNNRPELVLAVLHCK